VVKIRSWIIKLEFERSTKYVPGLLNWNSNEAPVFKGTGLKAFESETTVYRIPFCWFVRTTVVPLATVMVEGVKAEFWMVTVTDAGGGNSGIGVRAITGESEETTVNVIVYRHGAFVSSPKKSNFNVWTKGVKLALSVPEYTSFTSGL